MAHLDQMAICTIPGVVVQHNTRGSCAMYQYCNTGIDNIAIATQCNMATQKVWPYCNRNIDDPGLVNADIAIHILRALLFVPPENNFFTFLLFYYTVFAIMYPGYVPYRYWKYPGKYRSRGNIDFTIKIYITPWYRYCNFYSVFFSAYFWFQEAVQNPGHGRVQAHGGHAWQGPGGLLVSLMPWCLPVSCLHTGARALPNSLGTGSGSGSGSRTCMTCRYYLTPGR